MVRDADATSPLDELSLYLRIYANLARASVLLECDRERAGWFLEAAEAAIDDENVLLAADVLHELRRLVRETARHWRAGDVHSTEGTLELAEGLSLLRMLALHRNAVSGQTLTQ